MMKRRLLGNEAKKLAAVLILVPHTVYRQINTSHLPPTPHTFNLPIVEYFVRMFSKSLMVGTLQFWMEQSRMKVDTFIWL